MICALVMMMCFFVFVCAQAPVFTPAELVQCRVAYRVCCGVRQPGHGHRKQHQVPGGLSHHPRPAARSVHFSQSPSLCISVPTWSSVLVKWWRVVFYVAGLLCPDLVFIEACLRCLRTVFINPVTPVQLLYTVRWYWTSLALNLTSTLCVNFNTMIHTCPNKSATFSMDCLYHRLEIHFSAASVNRRNRATLNVDVELFPKYS